MEETEDKAKRPLQIKKHVRFLRKIKQQLVNKQDDYVPEKETPAEAESEEEGATTNEERQRAENRQAIEKLSKTVDDITRRKGQMELRSRPRVNYKL